MYANGQIYMMYTLQMHIQTYGGALAMALATTPGPEAVTAPVQGFSKCLIEVVQHADAVWRSQNVQKPMGPEIFINKGAQTMPNFLIIRTKQ